jgi:hypothetical protein
MRAVLPGLLPIRYTWGEATRRTLKMRVIVLSLLALTRPAAFPDPAPVQPPSRAGVSARYSRRRLRSALFMRSNPTEAP